MAGSGDEALFPAIASGLHHLVILTNNDDWQALFKDGVLVEQAHEITIWDVAKHVPIASLRYEDMPLSVNKTLYDYGEFPHGIRLEDARVFGGKE